jgi:transposase
MAGRFEGLTDIQWEVLEAFMPKEEVSVGKPHTPWRKVCNTILWILISGGRWIDVPIGQQGGSKSASHRGLGIWQEEGTLNKILSSLLEIAELEGRLDWDRLSADGFFSAGKGGGELID